MAPYPAQLARIVIVDDHELARAGLRSKLAQERDLTVVGEATDGAGFSVRADVSPNPVSYGAYPTLYARSAVGAVCTASVLYSSGHAPRSFDGSARTVGSSGVVGWTWRM